MPTTLGHFRRERERAPAATPEGGRLGGGRGIRTPGAIADTTVFKTVSFGHSDSPPDSDHPTGPGPGMRPSHPRAQAHQTLDASAAQAEEVPGLLVGGRFLGAVEEAARERGGRRGPQRHADRQRRLDGVVDVPARRLGGLHVLVVRTEAAHPATGLTDEVVVDVVDEGAVAVLEVLDVGDARPIVKHCTANSNGGTHALADDPLLMFVFAGYGVALVVDACGEAGIAVGATPAVDAGTLEELGSHLEVVVGYGPPH